MYLTCLQVSIIVNFFHAQLIKYSAGLINVTFEVTNKCKFEYIIENTARDQNWKYDDI